MPPFFLTLPGRRRSDQSTEVVVVEDANACRQQVHVRAAGEADPYRKPRTIEDDEAE